MEEKMQISSPSWSDNRLIINEELQLQRIAATVVAIELLPYELSYDAYDATKVKYNLIEDFIVHRWLSSHGYEITRKLFIPKAIRQLISEPIDRITSEIDRWMKYHIPQVFVEWDQKRGDFVVKFIRDFVWTSFGTIDYVKTAEKWIAAADLEITLRQKYRLACLNCLTDTVRNLCRENPTIAVDEAVLERFPLMYYYWSLSMTNMDCDTVMIDDLAPPYVPIWTHLLEQMNENKRYLFSIGRMLKLPFPGLVVKELLPKFTEIEQRRLFSEKLPDLMKRFVKESYPQFAIQLWRYVKDTITSEMYNQVFKELRNMGHYFRFDDDGTPIWLGDLEMEMWRCAPDCLKRSMFEYRNGRFLCEWTYWFNSELHARGLRNDTFLLEMLSEASAEYRKMFWMAHWKELVIECKSKYYAKLINACLPVPKQANRFLNKLVDSSEMRNHLKALCDDLNFFEFAQFLDQFVRDTNLKADLKKRFIPNVDKLSERCRFSSISDKSLDAYRILLNDVYGSEIVGYVESFIRVGFIRCISKRESFSGRIIYASGERKSLGMEKNQIVVHYAERLCDEQQLQSVKQKLLTGREFFEAFAKENNNIFVWNKFLNWLVGGEEHATEEGSGL